MQKWPYQPSQPFVALVSCFLFLAIVFFALPHVAVVTHASEFQMPPFPVSVDPVNKVIISDNPLAFSSFSVASVITGAGDVSQLLAAAIMSTKVYQSLTPEAQHAVVITPGMRKEQVAVVLDSALDWSPEQRQLFLDTITEKEGPGAEGRLYPSTYILSASTTPAEAYSVIKDRFDARVLMRYASTTEALIPVDDTLTIASIIEREAGNTEEMRIISGILWNRLFAGMKLQADSTLQYVRGTSKNGWWPVPRSRDKFLDSPYNTYQNEGLPPSPIASPSVPAIMAALNPEATDCVYFFHAKGEFYCSVTYEEHVAALKKIYGRGK